MRDLLTDPMCRAKDLGVPIPPSPYGVSVCLPLWEHVIGYEEKDPKVVSKFQSGYPRFFIPPAIDRLIVEVEKLQARAGERALVFPRRIHAERCAQFLQKQSGIDARVVEHDSEALGIAFFPAAAYEVARRYWRFCGEIVSARQSEAALGISTVTSETEGETARRTIKERLARITDQSADDVFLFPSGMAANFAVHRMLTSLTPGRKTVQLDFPYVDVLKLQEIFGSGVMFLPFNNESDYEKLRTIIKTESLAGIFAELPSNPLMKCVDLRRVNEMLSIEKKEVPVIVDDTVATNVNVNAFLVADAVTTSLTKAFSGAGDVLAGCVILNGESAYHADFSAFMRAHHDNDLWRGDAVALELNSRDYADRVKVMSRNSIALHEMLAEHPAVGKVFHSITDQSGIYQHLLKDGGGHGCLLSLVMKDTTKAPAVYDAMEFCKGPSLGTNFTLACPYTLLAHYDELAWAESCGVDRTLIRVSCGLEPAEIIVERMKRALDRTT
ncbi:MAG: PLP-dependent transferase [Verrucomicrobia bacterium]|nr:PLP-dependent transferase [Verrucomicrobiota bacterium]